MRWRTHSSHLIQLDQCKFTTVRNSLFVLFKKNKPMQNTKEQLQPSRQLINPIILHRHSDQITCSGFAKPI